MPLIKLSQIEDTFVVNAVTHKIGSDNFAGMSPQPFNSE